VLFFPQDNGALRYRGRRRCFLISYAAANLLRAPGLSSVDFCEPRGVSNLAEMTLDYAIYYNGPVVLAFLLLLRPLIQQVGNTRRAVLAANC